MRNRFKGLDLIDRVPEELWFMTYEPVIKNIPKKKTCKNAMYLIYVIPEWSIGFPYFLQFKSEFGNKEFMI